MSELAVDARGVACHFGDLKAVDGVDLAVRPGEVLGIVGPDGAGKTTLLRVMVGVLSPTAGTVALHGHDTVKERKATRLLLGYMSQAFSLYEDLTIAENIRFFASLRGVPRKLRREREAPLLEFTRLTPFLGRQAGALSGGMKQKLGLICTLIHEPKVLFLDEPTNGVDPVSRREFWDIVGELRDRVTVVVATPYMDEAERCDRVALMDNGRFLALDTPEGLRSLIGAPVWDVGTERPFEGAEILERALPEAEVDLFGDRIHVVSDIDPARIQQILRDAGQIASVERIPPTLEDAFVQLTRGAA